MVGLVCRLKLGFGTVYIRKEPLTAKTQLKISRPQLVVTCIKARNTRLVAIDTSTQLLGHVYKSRITLFLLKKEKKNAEEL